MNDFIQHRCFKFKIKSMDNFYIIRNCQYNNSIRSFFGTKLSY